MNWRNALTVSVFGIVSLPAGAWQQAAVAFPAHLQMVDAPCASPPGAAG